MQNGCLIAGGSIGFFVINLILAKEEFSLLVSSINRYSNSGSYIPILYIGILVFSLFLQVREIASWTDREGNIDSYAIGKHQEKPFHPDSWPYYLATGFCWLIGIYGFVAAIWVTVSALFSFLVENGIGVIQLALAALCVVCGCIFLYIAFLFCILVGYFYFYVVYIFFFSQIRFSTLALGISIVFTLCNFFENSEWSLIISIDYLFAFIENAIDFKLTSFGGIFIYCLQTSRSIYQIFENIIFLVSR